MSDEQSPVEVELTLPLRLKKCRVRASPRFICPPGATGTLRAGEEKTSQRGTIRDISRTGLGMLLPRELAPQTPVLLKLRDPQHRRLEEILAFVAHVTPQAPGEWLVGCSFARALTEAELRSLLATPERLEPRPRRALREGRNHELN